MDEARSHETSSRYQFPDFLHDKRPRQGEEAYEDSLMEEMERGFHLPISHRPTENLDTDNLEQATLDTQLTSANVGFRLLQKMGWKGKGLGKDEQGIVEPIKAGARDAKLGLGKQEQDDFFTAEENIHRKKLDVELEETRDLVKKREVEAEREQKIQLEVKEIRKVFLCELCNKQYKSAMEFDAHLSSYDHNHRKRFKEMREQQGGRDRDNRQKREQVRQEKEIAKLAEAQRQQQLQEQDKADLESENVATSTVNTATSFHVSDNRAVLKFGFGSKPASSKVTIGASLKKTKVTKVASIFNEDSDE